MAFPMPTSINQGGIADCCRAAMEFGIQRLDESSRRDC
jgi:hypothetical protein